MVSKIFISFGIGLVAGAAIGVMIAPASGEETRENIGKITNDSIDSFLGQAVKGLSAARNILREMNENRASILSNRSN